MALVNRSPKITANWALAMDHSRGGIFHSFSERFKTRNKSFMAASSVGKWPLARTARRSLAFRASMALVTGMRVAVPTSGPDRGASGVGGGHPGQRPREEEVRAGRYIR